MMSCLDNDIPTNAVHFVESTVGSCATLLLLCTCPYKQKNMSPQINEARMGRRSKNIISVRFSKKTAISAQI